ncbi:MAG TPA: hypothetical protein VKU01_19005 [Bryobacteraceae bacterium]|nr:hypothetical protein [Bryobacteraceae bacterium]
MQPILRRYSALAVALSALALLQALRGQSCSPINFFTTPRIYPPAEQAIGSQQQADGSFTESFGPRRAPFLLGANVPNIQNTLAGCCMFVLELQGVQR